MDNGKNFNKNINSVFLTRSIEELVSDANNQPPIKMLCGTLIYEEEQTILFSKQGLGKSILATQIAFSVCRGENLDLGNGIVLKNEVGKLTTLYFDFELADKQNLKRIANEPLPDNLFYSKRARGKLLEGNPREIFNILKTEAETVNAKFIILDNVSKISGDLEKSENAKQFLDPLWDLCRHEGYTILIIAHTPKTSAKEPITEDSVSGSAKFTALSDAIIGINQVNDDKGKSFYIKQIKTRNGEKNYSIDNVICTNIGPSDTGFVRHYCYDTLTEKECLNANNQSFNNEYQTALQYKKTPSYRKVGEALGINHCTVKKRVDKFKDNNPDEFIEIGKMDDNELNELLETFD